jgi:hypothetical protein
MSAFEGKADMYERRGISLAAYRRCDVVVYAVIGFGEPHKWLVVTDEISVRGRRPPRLKIRHRLFACCRIPVILN